MRSLELYKPDNSTNVRLSRLFSKILPKQKDNLNSILISIRRNDAIKKYNAFLKTENPKKYEKFDNSYNLYIDTINEYIMNKIYKRVKYGIATEYETNVLSNYYYILKLKDNKYDEYKYRKQKYLLKLDYYNVEEEKIFIDYKKMYEEKTFEIYNKLLKIYEDNVEDRAYINNILKIIDEYCSDQTLEDTFGEYEIIEKYTQFKDESEKDSIIDTIKKNEMLLEIANKVFDDTISKDTLNQMYTNIVKKINTWLNDNIKEEGFDEVYNLLLDIIKKYNTKASAPVELEKEYLAKEGSKYNELLKHITKKRTRKKKDAVSKKEEKDVEEKKPKKRGRPRKDATKKETEKEEKKKTTKKGAKK